MSLSRVVSIKRLVRDYCVNKHIAPHWRNSAFDEPIYVTALVWYAIVPLKLLLPPELIPVR